MDDKRSKRKKREPIEGIIDLDPDLEQNINIWIHDQIFTFGSLLLIVMLESKLGGNWIMLTPVTATLPPGITITKLLCLFFVELIPCSFFCCVAPPPKA
jgi:hypothetical protein